MIRRSAHSLSHSLDELGLKSERDDRPTDPAPPQKPTPFPGAKHAFRVGDVGDLIRTIQRALGVPDTGGFNTETERAVKDFQSAHGLQATGEVDAGTWVRIHEAKR